MAADDFAFDQKQNSTTQIRRVIIEGEPPCSTLARTQGGLQAEGK
jgi:hypothetical protein